ncbi:hypothetical protein ALC56_08685 [Trachymyrmex septentrionalis]|uniref:Uncharacterized protein n=1 Tax=Trachymyrmex septentrionalis TaxID=34720 RepID=A0A195FA21_9HYME|nr:hypothetical protein ALC56_08685 [Trachymyrmex septentrionalis]
MVISHRLIKYVELILSCSHRWHCRDINNLAHGNNRASSVVLLFMHQRHFIGQDVLVSAILDSKVHRRRAYQPAEQHSPKRGRDIAIGGEDGSVP